MARAKKSSYPLHIHQLFFKNLAFALLLLISIGTVLIRCSLSGVTVGGGGSTLPNDPIPSGSLVVQGLFSGMNGQTVSGTAAIYTDGTTVTLRIANLVTSVTSGLQVQVYASNSSTALCTINLVYYTGTKNYTCSSAMGGTYSSVDLYSITNQLNYAVAQLR